jgi:hypothetical protein
LKRGEDSVRRNDSARDWPERILLNRTPSSLHNSFSINLRMLEVFEAQQTHASIPENLNSDRSASASAHAVATSSTRPRQPWRSSSRSRGTSSDGVVWRTSLQCLSPTHRLHMALLLISTPMFRKDSTSVLPRFRCSLHTILGLNLATCPT